MHIIACIFSNENSAPFTREKSLNAAQSFSINFAFALIRNIAMCVYANA